MVLVNCTSYKNGQCLLFKTRCTTIRCEHLKSTLDRYNALAPSKNWTIFPLYKVGRVYNPDVPDDFYEGCEERTRKKLKEILWY